MAFVEQSIISFLKELNLDPMELAEALSPAKYPADMLIAIIKAEALGNALLEVIATILRNRIHQFYGKKPLTFSIGDTS